MIGGTGLLLVSAVLHTCSTLEAPRHTRVMGCLIEPRKGTKSYKRLDQA
jgi:hypothetical protein